MHACWNICSEQSLAWGCFTTYCLASFLPSYLSFNMLRLLSCKWCTAEGKQTAGNQSKLPTSKSCMLAASLNQLQKCSAFAWDRLWCQPCIHETRNPPIQPRFYPNCMFTPADLFDTTLASGTLSDIQFAILFTVAVVIQLAHIL